MKTKFRFIDFNKNWILFCTMTTLSGLIMYGMTRLIEVFSRIVYDKNGDLIPKALFLFIAWALGSFFIRYSRNTLKSKVIYDWNTKMKTNLMDRLLSRKVQDFNKNDKAYYISIFNNDIKFIEEKYVFPCAEIFSNIIAFIVTFSYALTINKYMAIIIVLAGFLIMIISKRLGELAATDNDNHFSTLKGYNEILNDGLYGFETLYRTNKSKAFMKLFETKTNKVESSHSTAFKSSGKLIVLVNYASITIQTLIIFISAIFVFRGIISPIYYPVLLSLMSDIIFPMQEIADNYGSIKSSENIRKNFVEDYELSFYDEEIDTVNSQKNNLLPEIFFNEVSFSYGDKIILNSASFQIEKGEHVMIVGDSGSGKSTILKLLTKELYYDDGEIYIEGENLLNMSKEKLFGKIAVIPQKPMIFRNSILQNIVLFEDEADIDFEKVKLAVEKSGLKELIAKLPEGLNTVLLDSGDNLSGGERQRIEIARALYRDADIFLIDEATSALDLPMALELEKIFSTLDKIIVSISHRRDIEYKNFYNRVLRINNKKIYSEDLK
ncbi:ATP-binding cassette domain-containing protein [Neofamilia massiliensis]|uniref:ATP-binding cassette domain-containing protein n=1 Tax=Neofamilia massiliensis TaxID=1673724 RepID=UPI0006BB841D|nr:ABC transporter ATP-binding protein [Neofamilia massiliensis]